MKSITPILNKYFDFSKTTVYFALYISFIGLIFTLLHALLPAPKLYMISASVGVFVTSITLVHMLNEPFFRKIRYGFFFSLFCGITFSFGSFFSHNILIVSSFIFILAWFVGFAYGVNHFFFSCMLFVLTLLIVGTGFPATSFMIALGNGVFYFSAGLISTCFFLLNKNWNFKSFTKESFIQIPKLKTFSKKQLHYSIQLSLLLLAANFFSYYFQLYEGFWVPMTVVLVLNPNFEFSKKRMKHRFWGTFFGSFFGFLFIFIDNKIYLSLFMFPLLFFIVISIARHYGSYVFFLTAMISILIHLISVQGIRTLEYRLFDTCLGLIFAGFIVYSSNIIRRKIELNK